MRRGLLASAIAACATAASAAPTLSIVYQFKGAPIDGLDYAGLHMTMDAKGNLVGATEQGGTTGTCFYLDSIGCGTLFTIRADGNYSVLYNFGVDYLDALLPTSPLVLDADGNQYGTTQRGGNYDYGAVYKVDVNGKATVLHSFMGGASDAYQPLSNLVRDAAGNLYGTANWGGRGNCNDHPIGCGLVWKIDAAGKYKVLHHFRNSKDGNNPASLALDAQGNLIGTTVSGGRHVDDVWTFGAGTLFKIAPDGTKTTLHHFDGNLEGAGPLGAIAIDKNGTVYGTTGVGASAANAGAIWSYDSAGHFKVLARFDGDNGMYPEGGLTLDAKGNLYGTTYAGGPAICEGMGCGVVWKLDTKGQLSVLYRFDGAAAGMWPSSTVTLDKAGNLFGHSRAGRDANGNLMQGTVWKLTP